MYFKSQLIFFEFQLIYFIVRRFESTLRRHLWIWIRNLLHNRLKISIGLHRYNILPSNLHLPRLFKIILLCFRLQVIVIDSLHQLRFLVYVNKVISYFGKLHLFLNNVNGALFG